MTTPLLFPLHKTATLNSESESFRDLDLSHQTIIPIQPHPGSFAIERRHHFHEGVDLYGQEGDLVFAMESGKIVFKGPFTGPKAGAELSHWLDTDAVALEGEHGVIFYGEITVAPHLQLGEWVEAGTCLGHLSRVLRNDKGRPLFMLHLERYEHGIHQSCGIWTKDISKPTGLLDPTPLLEAALNHQANISTDTSPPSTKIKI